MLCFDHGSIDHGITTIIWGPIIFILYKATRSLSVRSSHFIKMKTVKLEYKEMDVHLLVYRITNTKQKSTGLSWDSKYIFRKANNIRITITGKNK